MKARHVLLGICASLALQAHAQTAVPAAAKADVQTLNYRLQPREIASNTWVIEGAVEDFARSNGCNIINTAFIAADEGVLVINTGPSRRYGEQQRKAVENINSSVVRVLNLNLHPDYFLGNQAWADKSVQALPGSQKGMQQEGDAYADNLYRICGDWMSGTVPQPANQTLQPQVLKLGAHTLELRRLSGHTADDLVVLDKTTGVLFAGGLIFNRRVPTTPHADATAWLQSLETLTQWHAQGQFKWVVPSHGPVHTGLQGIEQTRDWLQWVVGLMRSSAAGGVDLSELLRTPIPQRFSHWAAQPAEFHRTLAQWYPLYEQQALGDAAP